jgi:hypothetical protein
LDGAQENIGCQDECNYGTSELAGEQHVPAVESIDEIASRRPDDKERDSSGEGDDADKRWGVGDDEGKPAERDLLHPLTDGS